MGNGEVRYDTHGVPGPLLVSTQPEYYGDHPDSVAFWSQGDAALPMVEAAEAVPSVSRQGDLLG